MILGRTAILHLGTFKTGSSSLQNLLYANSDPLAELDVLYPAAGLIRDEVIGNRHRDLISRYMKGELKTYMTETLSHELRTTTQSRVIISNESWSSPRHLPMLGGFVGDLCDMGFGRVCGIGFLRRLIDYRVSHFREFTYNWGNRAPFDAYSLGTPGMFDFLFLTRNYRTIFATDLQLLRYDAASDTVTAFFAAAGLSDLLPGLVPVAKANVRPVGALGIEVIRQANKAGLNKADGRAVLARFEANNPALFQQEWTERTAPETFCYGRSYRQTLAACLGWQADEVDMLLEDRPISGRPVSEATTQIAQAVTKASPVKGLRRAKSLKRSKA